MQLFFDIDGVLLDFEKGFMEYIRTHYHPELPMGFRPQTWEMDGEFADVDIDEAWEGFTTSIEFQRLEALGDVNLFNNLYETHEIHLVTNLTYSLREARAKNLDFVGLKYHSLNLGGHHTFEVEGYPLKSAVMLPLVDESKKMIFVDDHPKNCEDVSEHYPKAQVYLMSRPHNLGYDSPWLRVESINQLIKLLEPSKRE
ncbi:MAG: hypothetical protein QNL04_06015 [SAR324 cluster bacterium]|nr:hypothetical protein [SAR324 cluster bacterium]